MSLKPRSIRSVVNYETVDGTAESELNFYTSIGLDLSELSHGAPGSKMHILRGAATMLRGTLRGRQHTYRTQDAARQLTQAHSVVSGEIKRAVDLLIEEQAYVSTEEKQRRLGKIAGITVGLLHPVARTEPLGHIPPPYEPVTIELGQVMDDPSSAADQLHRARIGVWTPLE